jgi:hypothetical protein
MKKINFCRNCKCKKIKKLFSLGNLNFSGKFPLKDQKIPSTTLTLVMCNDCKLVQLQEKFSLKYLYNEDYGYRTGINKTMKSHVKKVVNYLSNKVHLNKNDNVLDIASNDGTLLKNYKKNIIKWGIDPIIQKKFLNVTRLSQ